MKINDIKIFFSAISFSIHSIIIVMKVYKDMVGCLIEELNLTKRQAKKIAVDAMSAVGNAYENNDGFINFGFLSVNMIMIYSIRNNVDYSDKIHNYCDDDVKLISEVVNDVDNEDVFTIAEKKFLNKMIAKYMNSYDKYRESKKYSGIWY